MRIFLVAIIVLFSIGKASLGYAKNEDINEIKKLIFSDCEKSLGIVLSVTNQESKKSILAFLESIIKYRTSLEQPLLNPTQMGISSNEDPRIGELVAFTTTNRDYYAKSCVLRIIPYILSESYHIIIPALIVAYTEGTVPENLKGEVNKQLTLWINKYKSHPINSQILNLAIEQINKNEPQTLYENIVFELALSDLKSFFINLAKIDKKIDPIKLKNLLFIIDKDYKLTLPILKKLVFEPQPIQSFAIELLAKLFTAEILSQDSYWKKEILKNVLNPQLKELALSLKYDTTDKEILLNLKKGASHEDLTIIDELIHKLFSQESNFSINQDKSKNSKDKSNKPKLTQKTAIEKIKTSCGINLNNHLLKLSKISFQDHAKIILDCYQGSKIQKESLNEFLSSSIYRIEDRKNLFLSWLKNPLFDTSFKLYLLDNAFNLQIEPIEIAQFAYLVIMDSLSSQTSKILVLKALNKYLSFDHLALNKELRNIALDDKNSFDFRFLALVSYIRSQPDTTNSITLIKELFNTLQMAKTIVDNLDQLNQELVFQALLESLNEVDLDTKFILLQGLLRNFSLNQFIVQIPAEVIEKISNLKINKLARLADTLWLLKTNPIKSQKIEDSYLEKLETILFNQERWLFIDNPNRKLINEQALSELNQRYCIKDGVLTITGCRFIDILKETD